MTKDEKRMHGRGIFAFANGNKYVGMFHDGEFHGEGIIFFTEENGGGQYRGLWEGGRAVSGEYVFNDGLQFEKEGWGHCTDQDRRYWDEYLTFIKPPAAGSDDVTMVPDYSVTNGIPPTFSGGKPRGLRDVQSLFWTTADAPRPEHEHKEVIDKSGATDPAKKDMATLIAEANGDVDRDASNHKAGRPPVPPQRRIIATDASNAAGDRAAQEEQ